MLALVANSQHYVDHQRQRVSNHRRFFFFIPSISLSCISLVVVRGANSPLDWEEELSVGHLPCRHRIPAWEVVGLAWQSSRAEEACCPVAG